jgi:phosphatidylinositol phospholipase C delta
MFLRNGGAGYLLKPSALLDSAYPSDLKKHPHTKHVLRIRVISAQQLPRPKDHQGYEVIDRNTVDPYVKVTIHIPIWASSQSNESIAPVAVGPIPSKEEAKAQPGEVRSSSRREEGLLAESGAAGDEQAGAAVGERVVKVRTRTIRNNGFNPVWDDELRLPFDVFGEGMKDLVFIRFLIKDDNEMEKDDFVGGYCTSLGSLEMGECLLRLLVQLTDLVWFRIPSSPIV